MSDHDREARQARTAHVAALPALERAMNAFAEADIPLAPDEDRTIHPWTKRHVAVMRACAQAWVNVVQTHRRYGVSLRQPTP